MISKKLLSAAAAALVLAACAKDEPRGPDVAYPGPTTPASFSSEASIGGVATAVLDATKGVSGVTGGGALVTMGAAASERATVKQALRLVAGARRANAAVLSGVVSASFTVPCAAGGSLTLSMQSGAVGVTTAGDYTQISFEQCTDDFGTVSWGSVRVEITATTGADFLADPTVMAHGVPYGLRMTFADFATVAASGAWSGMDGDVAVTMTADQTFHVLTWELSGTSIVGAEGLDDTLLHAFMLAEITPGAGYSDTFEEWYDHGFDLPPTAATWDFDGRVCAHAIGGCLNVTTDPPFSEFPSDLFPNEGTMTIIADTGAFIELAVVDFEAGTTGAVDVTYSFDGVVTFGPFSTTWTCLEAADSSGCFAGPY
jgi:hypothetical protein